MNRRKPSAVQVSTCIVTINAPPPPGRRKKERKRKKKKEKKKNFTLAAVCSHRVVENCLIQYCYALCGGGGGGGGTFSPFVFLHLPPPSSLCTIGKSSSLSQNFTFFSLFFTSPARSNGSIKVTKKFLLSIHPGPMRSVHPSVAR